VLIEAAWRLGLKTPEEVMEILEAFDLTGSLRGAAELAGCDHKTVAHWVRARDEAGGGLPAATRPRPRVDEFAAKIEEWVARSRGKIRADAAHQRLVAMGYVGSERTTRRAVAEAKRRWRQEHGRKTMPWVTEPGLWMQWDYGDGPTIGGRGTVLFCAWLAWSRYRIPALPRALRSTPPRGSQGFRRALTSVTASASTISPATGSHAVSAKKTSRTSAALSGTWAARKLDAPPRKPRSDEPSRHTSPSRAKAQADDQQQAVDRPEVGPPARDKRTRSPVDVQACTRLGLASPQCRRWRLHRLDRVACVED